MPLDPDIRDLLTLIDAVGQPPLYELPAHVARQTHEELIVRGRPTPDVPVGSVEDRTVPGPAGPVPVRVYRPERNGPLPTVVLLHGGGWVIGSIETHDHQARSLCRLTDAVVVSVGYRLAPEAPFPAAVEDSVAALGWADEHIAELGGDPGRLAIAGDSAGGNLAAVVSQLARDTGGPQLVAQLLIYPAVDLCHDYPSVHENAHGYFLEHEDMLWFRDHYVVDPALHTDPRVSPLRHPDLSGLPPAVVVTAEYDPLRDEAETYAARLREAGVPVAARRFDGLVHGFFGMGVHVPAAQAAVEETCSAFRALLHPAG